MYVCNTNVWEVEEKGSGIHDHSWLSGEAEARLDYMKPFPINKTKGRDGHRDLLINGKTFIFLFWFFKTGFPYATVLGVLELTL